MARLVIEDSSEDEFPDLARLLSSKTAALRVKATSADRRKIKSAPREEKETALGECRGLGDEEKKKKDKGSENVGVKKKRVLKQRDDNPLLRPVGTEAKGLGKEILGSETGDLVKGSRAKEVRERKRVPEKTFDISVSRGLDEEVSMHTGASELVEKALITEKPNKRRVQKNTAKDSSFPGCSTVPDSGDEKKEEEDFAHGLDDDDDDDDDYDGLSDFIINDSEILEEEDSLIEMPAPRSVRRLVRGRRAVDDDDDLERELKR